MQKKSNDRCLRMVLTHGVRSALQPEGAACR